MYASGDALFKSPLWQQILVDALGVRIHFISGEKHATGRGAAILAVSLAFPAVPSRPHSCLLVCALGCGGAGRLTSKMLSDLPLCSYGR